ncbi:MAG: 4-hydroxy-3-methylbut-2-enyl diphosphate reductase [Bacteroidota bacterium]
MARKFDVPVFYRSPFITKVKEARRIQDPRKKDFTPSTLDFGPIRFHIARHFGFCYGVEQAVDIAYRALEENEGKRIFLLSEMIHNPHVNRDLQDRGMQFLRTTSGEQLIPFDTLTPEDVVLIPAFGASVEIEADLRARGIDTISYNTTCPFVEKVWKRSDQLGNKDYAIVVHGKRYHEETRATFSHARQKAPVVVVLNMEEAQDLADVITGKKDRAFFYTRFADRYSEGFDPDLHLSRIGVVNQTTMLASETAAIAALLRRAIIDRYGEDNLKDHFADTSDTLCYATNENQQATQALIEAGGDLAIIVGGYNSSNTSHLVELAELHMPAYFVNGAEAIGSPQEISHFDLHRKQVVATQDWLPEKQPVDIVLTAGASCPDAVLDEVMRKLLSWFPNARSEAEVLQPFVNATD